MNFAAVTDRLVESVAPLTFAPPVACVYNPLVYARRSHDAFCQRFGTEPKEILLVGMNPGPFGMAQTGVPFGDVSMVRDWMGIEARVDHPSVEHPKRPIQGFACPRNEVSGTRLWGWARDRYGAPENFFRRFFVWNYCPLCFVSATGSNLTPDKLPVAERAPLFAACNAALEALVDGLRPRYVIGVGQFAEHRAREALGGRDLIIGRMLHPSPASPAANRGWAEAAERGLAKLNITL